MVRLKPNQEAKVKFKNLCLNSTMVRLKLYQSKRVYHNKGLGLNSTMVRLKLLKIWNEIKKIARESQFHYGSIKTAVRQLGFANLFKSQFHYGSIKTKKKYGTVAIQDIVSIPLWFD